MMTPSHSRLPILAEVCDLNPCAFRYTYLKRSGREDLITPEDCLAYLRYVGGELRESRYEGILRTARQQR